MDTISKIYVGKFRSNKIYTKNKRGMSTQHEILNYTLQKKNHLCKYCKYV